MELGGKDNENAGMDNPHQPYFQPPHYPSTGPPYPPRNRQAAKTRRLGCQQVLQALAGVVLTALAVIAMVVTLASHRYYDAVAIVIIWLGLSVLMFFLLPRNRRRSGS